MRVSGWTSEATFGRPVVVSVVTGSRADYGLLRWLLEALRREPGVELKLVATGMHLAAEFGHTYREIEADGFSIARKVPLLLSDDTAEGIAKSVGLGIISLSDCFQTLRPDLVIVLGDRFEIFAAAQASLLNHIPVAHLHGGETTEGAIDEMMRHAITKLSHLHFVSADLHRDRVVRMGESPERVFNVGALGLDNIEKLNLLTKAQFEERINFQFGPTNFLVTYHPATLGAIPPVEAFAELVEALKAFPEARILLTLPNADEGGRSLISAIRDWEKTSSQVKVYSSLGQLLYLSALKNFDVVIGNSSSGLIEAPAFGLPTVNIGPRQKGRLHGPTVLNCPEDRQSIQKAIEKALSAEFRAEIAEAPPAYGVPGAARKIVDILSRIELSQLRQKIFYEGAATHE